MTHHTQAKMTGPGDAAVERISPAQNHLLSALSPGARARVFPLLKPMHLARGSVLYEPEARPHYIYFPTSCIVSLLVVLRDGASTGIATVGNDGAIGVALATGGETMTNRAVVQIAGFAYRLSRTQLQNEFARDDELFRILLCHAHALITQIAQTAVCNRHHSLDQQLCRWLLMSLDRQSSNELTMTQELIANALGVRREGVTEAAGRLQKQGVIRYSRGQITVLDRQRLEQLCCECYGTVNRETERLLRLAHARASPRLPPARHRTRYRSGACSDPIEVTSDVSIYAGTQA